MPVQRAESEWNRSSG